MRTTAPTRLLLGAALMAVGLGACGSSTRRAAGPVRLPRQPAVRPAVHNENFPMPAAEAARRLAGDDFEIVANKGAGGGTTGVRRLTLVFQPDGARLDVKWRPAPRRDADGFNNSPRKELAAYAVQQLFLDPDDYVVPPTVVRCISLEAYSWVDPDAKRTIERTHCVMGMLVLWLQDVTVPEVLLDEDRFGEDWSYAFHMANMNLLTYVIDHRDGRSGNFMMSKGPSGRIFAVDNGVSFRPRMYNFFVPNWNTVRVPGLPRQSVERLRKVTRADLEPFATLVEFRADDRGVLQIVEPGPNLDPDKGSRREDGRVLQLGLRTSEIDMLEERIAALLARVDAGEIPVF